MTVTGVLTLDDIAKQGDTLATFLWLAVLFALSAQLNELGFTSYMGERLALRLDGLSWPVMYVTLVALYVGLHYFFVSQSSRLLALFAVFLDVGIRGGVPVPLMAFGLLFASSYFSGHSTGGEARTSPSWAVAISHNASSTGWGSSPRPPSCDFPAHRNDVGLLCLGLRSS